MNKILLLLTCVPFFAAGQTPVLPSLPEANDNIKFVADFATITSFDKLLKHFEGRTVYIDLWATWCGPCVEEFKHKDGLNAFVKEHDIDVLYISMDEDKNDEKW